MAYGEIMRMEMNVSMNKIKDEDFKLGVNEVLLKPSKQGLKNPGYNSDVPESLVDTYFQEN